MIKIEIFIDQQKSEKFKEEITKENTNNTRTAVENMQFVRSFGQQNDDDTQRFNRTNKRRNDEDNIST